MRFEGFSNLGEVESVSAAAQLQNRDAALAGESPDLLRGHREGLGELFGGCERWRCLCGSFYGSHTPARNVTFARMNPRTLRRHRQRAREGKPPPKPSLGRPSGETARARDAEALQFCEAVFACLEAGEIPAIEALRQYPRHPAPPGPPVWRSGSPSVRKLIEGIPARVLLLAVWDSMPSLLVAKARGLNTAKGRTSLTKWAKGRTAKGRGLARAMAVKEAVKLDGFFGDETRSKAEAIGDALMSGFADHPSTRFARQMAETPLADVAGRKHRGAGAVLGMSRRMVCHYRQREEYGEALALLDQFKRRTRAKFGGAASKPQSKAVDYLSGEETTEIDFDAMDARLGRD